MFGIYDHLSEGFISSIDNVGCNIGNPIIFDSEELAEAFLIWFCAWLGGDDDSYEVVDVSE